jgi:chaperonin GroEL
VKEGIVAGGGVALLRATSSIDTKGMETDVALGTEILRKAMEGPARQIIANAGLEPAVVVNDILSKKGSNGFDARNEEFVDMVKAGIIDPTLVTRTAVQNAASIAGLLLTTEAVISDKPEPEGAAAPAMPDMGGMGGMGGMM